MSVRKSLSMTSAVFLVVFSLSLVSAQNELELSPESDLGSVEEIQELLRNVQTIFQTKIASKVQQETVSDDDDDDDADDADDDGDGGEEVDSNGCRCSGLRCSCCTYINVRRIGLRTNACIRLAYLRRNIGILVTLTLGSRTIFSREVSARNPPPICAGIPYLKRGGSVCIQFYNLYVSSRYFCGCSRIQLSLFYITVFKANIGCFRVNYLNETKQGVGDAEFPYIDVPETLPQGPEPIFIGEVEMEKIKPADDKKN